MTGDAAVPEPGVSRALAVERTRTISDVRYALALEIPALARDPIEGTVAIRFRPVGVSGPVILDFDAGPGPAAGPSRVRSARINGRPSAFHELNGHIVLPRDAFELDHLVELSFQAGDSALNRHAGGLYSLFVPAHARRAFPCFDQPDLRARFTLELTLPEHWQAVSNAVEVSRERVDAGRVRVRFGETESIPTYLFAFAAGPFVVEAAERGGRTIRMFHQESDAAKLARERDAVFDLHASALAWLEAYTAIPYPFQKFDIVLIPSFQFGGMEHPGTIYYNAGQLLLDESATEHQRLARAHLIAHETAHMWFGDLVTLAWFDDVWMKEVFANLMAAKIVNPAFPDLDHELRFLLSHYPAAYSVDRTAGTHPIRQDLDNLRDAGSLYGPIIYQKSPIVMREFEERFGVERFRDALRIYLARFSFGAASWPDLARIFDERALAEQTGVDVATWSRTWIEGTTRPPLPSANSPVVSPVWSPACARGARWIERWEDVLDARITAAAFLDTVLAELPKEDVEQNVQLVVGYLHEAFWRLLPVESRPAYASRLERLLGFEPPSLFAAADARTSTLTAARFQAFRSIATTAEAVDFLERVWRREASIDAVALSDADDFALALELSVRSVSAWANILEAQQQRIVDEHLRARFAFVAPATSVDASTRDAFFDRLCDERERRHEPWVIEGLRWLNHPLRAEASLKHLRASLDLLEEVERTGDIFFPKRWLDAVLAGHSSPPAAAIVRGFLEEQPRLPARLHRLVLQSADTLFRAIRF